MPDPKPTSQTRDVGHLLLGRDHETWATRPHHGTPNSPEQSKGLVNKSWMVIVGRKSFNHGSILLFRKVSVDAGMNSMFFKSISLGKWKIRRFQPHWNHSILHAGFAMTFNRIRIGRL
jgi:hypothetical protein